MNPLRISCKNCGSPVGFDIIGQTYRCKHCGEASGIQEVKNEAAKWRILNRENRRASETGERPAEYCCTACGARILFKGGDASETCDFCGSKLIRAEFTDEGQTPDMIIPFFITAEEARERMLAWGHGHEKTPEGRALVSSMGKLKGYYLPYQLVRGPVYARVSRDGSERKYQCAGYLEGTAVSTSDQIDNIVLNEMEPFDWSAMRPFEYGYVAGQNVKLSNMTGKQIERCVLDETAADFLPEVERVMQTSGVKVDTSCENLMGITALLPVYFIKNGRLTVVMNGQTGRIAVSKNRKKKSNPWVIEPLVYTLIATVLLSIPYHFDLYNMFLFGFVFAAIFFSIMGEGRRSLVRRVTLRSEAARASRGEKGELKIEEGKDILKNPYDNTPVFYEKDPQGKDVPVKIKFYTPARCLSILVNVAVTVFLPLIIAAAIQWIETDTFQEFMAGFRPLYGAAWYILGGFIAIIYFAKGVRKDVYDHPILYEAVSGRKKKMGTRASRKLSVLSVLNLQEPDENGKQGSVLETIRALGGLGIFFSIFTVVLLFGSVGAILG